ncbi:MAG: hypothetical protein KIT60_17150 [Burkholderiaceae bacterium]|nr:hypothetical protein [Burkholderiaceae bacterium]
MGFAATALRMSSGVIVWGLHFAAIYGITGLACARAAPQAALIGVAVATLFAVALLLPIVVSGWRRRQEFESCFAAAVGALALLAVIWEALPALWVPTCG